MRDTNLANALREHADWWENGDMMDPLGGLEKDLLAAADRLENQNAHIAALQQEIEKLRGQNRQLMLERNYVISIIADVRKAGKTWMCQYCAHCKGIVSGMADCDSKQLCVMPYSQFELKRPEPPEVKL